MYLRRVVCGSQVPGIRLGIDWGGRGGTCFIADARADYEWRGCDHDDDSTPWPVL